MADLNKKNADSSEGLDNVKDLIFSIQQATHQLETDSGFNKLFDNVWQEIDNMNDINDIVLCASFIKNLINYNKLSFDLNEKVSLLLCKIIEKIGTIHNETNEVSENVKNILK